MSDIFDFSDVDIGDTASGAFNVPSIDFSSLTPSSTPLVPPVLNLPQPAGQGITGFLGDATKLITGVFQSDAQITAAQSAAAIAKAKAANQLETVKTTPNVWLVLGLGAGAIFILEAMGRSK